MNATIDIRHALSADAVPLAEFAARCFRETYAAVNDPADMVLHLERTFGPKQQAAEIADRAGACLLALHDEAIVGYAVIKDGAAHPSVAGPRPYEVRRFYVDHAWHGRGVAGALMMAARAEAAARGAATLWLSAWEHNPRALGFYAKQGFKDVGVATFTLGHAKQTDRVLALDLGSA